MNFQQKNKNLKKLEKHLRLRNYSKDTQKVYLIHVKKYFEFLKDEKDEQPNVQNVRNYILKKLEKNDPSSVHHSIFAIEYFFKNILNQKINIPKPKRNQKIPEILTNEEIKRMIDSLSNIKHKLILKVLYGCGLRVSEIINLKKQGVNLNEGLIYIKLGKGEKERVVKIPESLNEDLDAYIKLLNEEATSQITFQ